MKTNKSITKRIKITRQGKLLANASGRNHFNAKKSRRKQLTKRGKHEVTISKKDLSHLVPFHPNI